MASEHDRSGLILAGVENSTSLTGLLHHLQRERGREGEGEQYICICPESGRVAYHCDVSLVGTSRNPLSIIQSSLTKRDLREKKEVKKYIVPPFLSFPPSLILFLTCSS